MKRRLYDLLLHFLNRLCNWIYFVLLFIMLIENSNEVANIPRPPNIAAYRLLSPPPPQPPITYTTNVYNKNYFNVNNQILNDMKLQIKKILNMHPENRTLDKYVTTVFNIKSLNPTYIFVLPDHKNKTLIYRRSDFNDAIFPNVTNLNKFKKSPLNPNPSVQPPSFGPSKDVVSKSLDYDDFDEKDRKEPEEYDEQMMGRIIEENIRTERNFIEFIDNLNDDLEEEYSHGDLKKYNNGNNQRDRLGQESKISQIKVKAVAQLKLKRIQNSKNVDWTDLGLDGWFGGLSPVVNDFDTTIESPGTASNLTKKLRQPNPFLQTMKITTPKVKPSRLPISTYTSDEEPDADDISDTQTMLLDEENKELVKMDGKLRSVKPVWPITSSRELHKDEDIFIARANNPFGHSTKWKYRNSSTNANGMQPRESRSKRGVIQLYSMIKCANGCDPLIYKGYGCYCGFLGSGRALDGIDRCCKMHDNCYARSRCPMFLEYFVPYLWKCYRGKPLCAADHGEWGGPGSCAARLCECDRILSKCLRRHYCPSRRSVCTSSPFRLLQNLVMVF